MTRSPAPYPGYPLAVAVHGMPGIEFHAGENPGSRTVYRDHEPIGFVGRHQRNVAGRGTEHGCAAVGLSGHRLHRHPVSHIDAIERLVEATAPAVTV